MKYIFLGPPGAGKGTIASMAAREFGIPHISTGDLFRQAVKEGTELGKKVKAVLDSGGLVSDDLTIALVKERLSKPDAGKGWILDGFPRTVPQADALATFAPPDRAVDFTASDEMVVRRLSGRRTCRECGKIYHLVTMPPKSEGSCDACGGALYVRDDDREEAIRFRLKTYAEKTAPLIAYYAGKGSLVSIDGEADPDTVYAAFKRDALH
jgi:adenylate kinase